MLRKVPELIAEIRQTIACMTAEEAVQARLNDQGLLIDVREPAEFAAKSAKGAINIPRGLLEMKIGEVSPDASTPIYVHCASGGRATFAAEQLTRMGYEQVVAITCPVAQVCQVNN